MENGVGTVDGSSVGEHKEFENKDFEFKVEKVDMEGSNGLKDKDEDDVFVEATSVEITRADSGGKKSLGESLEVDRISAACETDKVEEAIDFTPMAVGDSDLEECLAIIDDVDIAVNTDDHSVDKGADREVVIRSGTDELVDDLKSDARELQDLVTADEIVSEYKVEASGNSDVVIEKSQNGIPFSDSPNEDGLVGLGISDIGAANKPEAQLQRELEIVDADVVGGRAQLHIGEPKEQISCETDNHLESNEMSSISNTEQQDVNNGDPADVLVRSQCDQNVDKVDGSFSGAGDEKVLDDEIRVNETSGVVLQKWQNGVPFSKILDLQGTSPPIEKRFDNGDDTKQEHLVHGKVESRDLNGFDGGKCDSKLQDTETKREMLNQIDNIVELNSSSAGLNNVDVNYNTVDLVDVSAGLHSGQQADEVERAPDKLFASKMEVRTASTRDLIEESSTIQGVGKIDSVAEEKTEASTKQEIEYQHNRSLLKDSSVGLDPKCHEGSSILEDNLHTSVEESSDTSEVGIAPFTEVPSFKENNKIEGAATHVEKNSNGSLTYHKSLSLEKSKIVAGTIKRVAMKSEDLKQTAKVIGEANNRPTVTAPTLTPSPTPTPTPTPSHPAGLGRAAPLLEPSSRVVPQTRVNGTSSHTHNQVTEESANGESEETDETREKLQMIRVKFLRLAHRLGQTPHNVVVAQVLYRLGLAEQLRGGSGGRVATFSFDRASAMAEQLESAGQEPLDFSCTIMVIGKTGVGKSATINSIFDQVTFGTDAFQMGTKKVQDFVGTVQGIKVRVIDTPGLLPSWSDQHRNEKILQSVKQFIKKSPPDIVLYLDRLDMQSRDSGDMPLLRTITDTFGPSIWFNAIVVLSHAASAPPEGPNGVAASYDMFVTQRTHVVQQAIRQAAGDMRLMNPVSLVENHSACRTNRAGQRVLPNGQVWKPHLLLLSFASKILAEANTLLKLQDSPPGKPFTARARAPPLPFLLTSLLRSRPQLKLPQEQDDDDDDDTLDDDFDESTNSDIESEYDELPPFKHLTKAQLAELSKSERRAYFDEIEYREKLYMKKQLHEDKQRRRIMKKMAAAAKDLPSDYSGGLEEETGGETSVPMPMADMPLPASFDSDNPTHRYRFLDTTNQWLVRPVHDSHSWDHDVGYEGVNMERSFVVKNKIPMSFSGQVTKDKKEAHFQMEVAGSVKHGERKATTLGFDMQQIGKDIAYTLRSDTKFSNFRRNKASASLSVTHMGDAVTAGVKVEDKLIVSRRAQVVMSGGAIAGRGDVAYGGSLEATLRDKDFPLGRSLTTMSLSVMDWHGDLTTGWNAQTQIPVGRFTNLIGSVNFNNRGQGQVSIRLNSSEQLQIALVALVPLIRKLLGYSQQMQFEY